MYCQTCGIPATIIIRHHRFDLCGTHFPPKMVGQTGRTRHKHRVPLWSNRIVVVAYAPHEQLAGTDRRYRFCKRWK